MEGGKEQEKKGKGKSEPRQLGKLVEEAKQTKKRKKKGKENKEKDARKGEQGKQPTTTAKLNRIRPSETKPHIKQPNGPNLPRTQRTNTHIQPTTKTHNMQTINSTTNDQ